MGVVIDSKDGHGLAKQRHRLHRGVCLGKGDDIPLALRSGILLLLFGLLSDLAFCAFPGLPLLHVVGKELLVLDRGDLRLLIGCLFSIVRGGVVDNALKDLLEALSCLLDLLRIAPCLLLPGPGGDESGEAKNGGDRAAELIGCADNEFALCHTRILRPLSCGAQGVLCLLQAGERLLQCHVVGGLQGKEKTQIPHGDSKQHEVHVHEKGLQKDENGDNASGDDKEQALGSGVAPKVPQQEDDAPDEENHRGQKDPREVERSVNEGSGPLRNGQDTAVEEVHDHERAIQEDDKAREECRKAAHLLPCVDAGVLQEIVAAQTPAHNIDKVDEQDERCRDDKGIFIGHHAVQISTEEVDQVFGENRDGEFPEDPDGGRGLLVEQKQVEADDAGKERGSNFQVQSGNGKRG